MRKENRSLLTVNEDSDDECDDKNCRDAVFALAFEELPARRDA
jgi:hypothetical protein